jgi:hypothetical protein
MRDYRVDRVATRRCFSLNDPTIPAAMRPGVPDVADRDHAFVAPALYSPSATRTARGTARTMSSWFVLYPE